MVILRMLDTRLLSGVLGGLLAGFRLACRMCGLLLAAFRVLLGAAARPFFGLAGFFFGLGGPVCILTRLIRRTFGSTGFPLCRLNRGLAFGLALAGFALLLLDLQFDGLAFGFQALAFAVFDYMTLARLVPAAIDQNLAVAGLVFLGIEAVGGIAPGLAFGLQGRRPLKTGLPAVALDIGALRRIKRAAGEGQEGSQGCGSIFHFSKLS